MLGLVKEISGQKTIIPLTTDTGTGAPVGTFIYQYKKVPMSGYLYCDGSTFDETAYPALYLYLGSNVLPDYRECVMVGAEQNTTDTIAVHDVYTQGQFKDDQIQDHTHYLAGVGYGADSGSNWQYSTRQPEGNLYASETVATQSPISARTGTTTHGKQKAVYVYIKATSGLAENQQENVLNATKDYVDNSNSYSTTETLTGGKWIDGKPIYRKVIDLGTLPDTTYKSVPTNISNLDTIVSLSGFAKSSDNSEQHSILSPSASNNAFSIDIYYNSGNLILSTGSDRASLSGFAILEYTKTTD